MRALSFLASYWYIPLLVIATILILIATRGRKMPWDVLGTELRAIDAGNRAREMEVRLGAERARRRVEEEHRATIAKLDAAQAEQAERLKDDPAALSRFLVRTGR